MAREWAGGHVCRRRKRRPLLFTIEGNANPERERERERERVRQPLCNSQHA
jgi:hypothetical protein